MAIDPALREEIRKVVAEEVAPIRVRREEHDAMVAATRELQVTLAEFQRDTQEAFARFEIRFERIEQAVRELAAAQVRTEETVRNLGLRIDELAAAQKRTDQRMEELAASHAILARSMNEFRQDLGQRVEEIAAEVVPHYLRHEEGIEVGELGQEYFKVDGQEFEVDLAGEGRQGEKTLLILCEAKASADVREVETLAETARKIACATGRQVFPVLFPTRCPGRARALARQVSVLIVPWRYQYRIA